MRRRSDEDVRPTAPGGSLQPSEGSLSYLQPGETFERYHVESMLGQGGMAEVYRVRHTGLDTVHALKVVSRPDLSFARRLRNEGQVQARISHPHIVGVRDVLKVKERDALVLDYVHGPDLDMTLQGRPMDPEELLVAFRAVATAVAHAHAHNVVHRDLKPANVLLDIAQAHSEVVPMVSDFGLVKSLTDSMALSAHTRTGTAMGTPAYMSPEQIANAKDVDRRADIWSLGCVLYVMATGKEPFVAPNLISLFHAISVGAFTPFEEAGVEVAPRVKEAVRAMLQPDIGQRVSDVVDVIDHLDGRSDQLVRPVPEGEPLPPARSATGIPGPKTLPRKGTLGRWAVEAYVDRDSSAPATFVPRTSADATSGPTLDSALAPTEKTSSGRRGPWVLGLAVLGLLGLVGVAGAVGVAWLGSGTGEVAEAPQEAPAPVAPEPVPEPEPAVVEAPAPAEPDQPLPAPEPAPTAVAAPVPAPVPVEPTPAPVPVEPEPEPEPEPAGVVVQLQGAEAVVLQGADGLQYRPPRVPSGRYLVMARFRAGASMVPAGEVVIPEGGAVQLQCQARMNRCAVQAGGE